MKQDEIQRLQAKTPEHQFVRMMEQEFNYAPKIAPAILDEAKECLLGQPQNLRPGPNDSAQARGRAWSSVGQE